MQQNKTSRIRIGASLICAMLLSAIPAQSQVSSTPTLFGEPLATLEPEQVADFFAGLDQFQTVFTPETGLGPIFNGESCASCHTEGGIGGGSAINVTRFGRMQNGKFDPMTDFGGSLLQQFATDPSLQEIIPPEANVVANRRSTPLFGLGLVEAISDAEIIANTRVHKAMGVVGRPAYVVDPATGEKRIGRFGWKAQHATLLAFAADASINELGVTNRLFSSENVPNGKAIAAEDSGVGVEDVVDEATGKSGIDRLADFMRYLAPPERLPFNLTIDNGERWFNQVGCAQCHVIVMFTGKSDIPALDRKPVFLYSDLLLHDMGSLGDGIAQGDAGPREIRTSPLWGLRMQSRFLHDGRAASVEAAILMHDGEAAPSREFYIRSLPRDQQLELLEYLLAI